MNNRNKDILKTVESLDVTPTMFKNANEKYHNIAKFLNDNGMEADFYPQGSFANGTVVRPNIKNIDAAYDLDAICQVKDKKEELTAKELFEKLKNIFSNSELYKSKMDVYENCITIKYAQVDGAGFSIDVVPAVEENEEIINLKSEDVEAPDLVCNSIAIPKKGECNYTWITSNPKGLNEWFERINCPFEDNAVEYRTALFESNRQLFGSVEEIPKELNRSSLQRVIQILKRHRDVYFDTLERRDKSIDIDSIKPISVMINVLVAEICKDADKTYSTFDLLGYVVDIFKVYSEYNDLKEAEFKRRYPEYDLIKKENGKWIINNPVLGGDNLANLWNQNANASKYFFKWIQSVKEDILDALLLTEDAEFRSHIDNAFGYDTVQKILGDKYRSTEPKVIPREVRPNPWKRV